MVLKQTSKELVELLVMALWVIGFLYRLFKPGKDEEEMKELLAAARQREELHSIDFIGGEKDDSESTGSIK